MDDCLMSTYNPLPIGFVRGIGARLYDTSDREYLDAVSGIAVTNLGHAHPAVTAALQIQAGQLLHTSNLYRIPLQDSLARKLCARANMERAFFCNSGTEANEAAIKLARLYSRQRNHESAIIIVTEGAFHGRTLGALSTSSNTQARSDFGPLLPGFVSVPYNSITALQSVVDKHDEVAAIMLEPIQGEAGVIIPAPGYLQAVRTLCDDTSALMILDEVQTGMCRTGRWFASQHETVIPDVMTLAKALGNGIPIGACLARNQAAETFFPGSHGSTFGGNPLAASTALAVLDTLESEQLQKHADTLGTFMLQAFKEQLGTRRGVRAIRGKGLMIGIEMEQDCTILPQQALQRGLLLNVTAQRVVRLLPPLILSEQEAEQIVDRASSTINDFLFTSHMM